jgi:hypothetical protein
LLPCVTMKLTLIFLGFCADLLVLKIIRIFALL